LWRVPQNHKAASILQRPQTQPGESMTQQEKNAEEITELRRALADQKVLIAKIIRALRVMPSTLPNIGENN
jgi:hypothetical protein